MLYKLAAAVLIFLTGWGAGWYMQEQQAVRARLPVQLQPPPLLPGGESEPVAVQSLSMTSDQTDELAVLLQHQDIDAVMAYYTQLQRNADEVVVNAARLQLLTHARALLESLRYAEAEQLLQALLVLDHRDVEAHSLLAAAYYGQDDFQLAIDQLYEAKGYAYRPAMLRAISDRLRSYVAGLVQSLKQQDDAGALLTLYQHLVQQEPEYAPYFVGLATAQLSLDDPEAARRSLSLVAQDASVGAQAQSMLQEINETLAQRQGAASGETAAVVGVPLQRNGNHFIVAARPANTRSIQLLIDTGASLTIVTPELFTQRGIRYEDTGRVGVFNTANGTVRAPIYRLAALQVGDWQVNELDVGVMDLGGSMDGLLGMNFLSHFQFFIDQNESVLRLSIN